jgi:DNA-binding transcriptional LysR family regulator
MIPVVAPELPLASVRGLIPTTKLAEHVQIVTSERGPAGDATPDQAVLSSSTWRVVDLHAKHRLLSAGLGWGRLPEHVARADLASGALVRIRPDAWGDEDHLLALAVVHRTGAALGPAARWLIAKLGELSRRELPGARTELRPADRRTKNRNARARSRRSVRGDARCPRLRPARPIDLSILPP